MNPTRVQLSRRKGWIMPENTVKVDRTTKWGNPWRAGLDGDAAECVLRYRSSMSPSYARRAQAELHGKNLACWCKIGDPCHADALLEIANSETEAK